MLKGDFSENYSIFLASKKKMKIHLATLKCMVYALLMPRWESFPWVSVQMITIIPGLKL